MTITLGRAGLNVPVTGYTSMQIGATQTQIDAVLDLSAIGEGERSAALWALTWTLSRYPTPEEPVVPLVLTGAVQWFCGFVEGAMATVTRTGGREDSATVSISFTRRLGVRMTAEVNHISTYRANSHTSPSAISRLARVMVPPEASPAVPSTLSAFTSNTLSIDEGVMTTITNTVTSAMFFDSSLIFAPTAYYKGACRIEQQAGGGTDWYAIPGGPDLEHLPDGTRISNGRTRLTLASSGMFTIEAYDAPTADWGTAQSFQLSMPSESEFVTGWELIEAKHNRREVVVLSCVATADIDGARVFVDFELRAGDAMVAITCTSENTCTWKLEPISGSASTNLGGSDYALTANTADAEGNWWVIATTDGGATLDATNSHITTVSAEQTNFGAGIATGASVPESPTALMLEYFAVRVEAEWLAAR